MIRNFTLLLAAAVCLAAAPAAADKAPMPTLKSSATITGEFVRLGDLIENAGEAKRAPLFRAPALGATGTIQVYRVIEAARTHGLSVFDTRGISEVLVTRASKTIPLSELEQAVAEAAARQAGFGEAKDISVTFDSGVSPLAVELGATAKPRVPQFSYDPRSQRFSAVIDVPDSAEIRRKPVRVSGYLYETAEVVTLAHSLTRGDVVRQNDILIERRPKSEIAPDAIRDSAEIIGQAVRRDLRSGQAVRSAELMKPELVGRNDPVTLVFESPGVVISVRAKAIESGAEGDVIQVLNQQSKRTVQGTIEGRGRVVVRRMQTARYADPVTTGSVK